MTATRTPLPRLEDYTAFVRRYLALLCIGMLTGAGVGLVIVLQQQPVYTATARVLLAPLPAHAETTAVDDVTPTLVTIDTDAQLVNSASVVDAVATATGLPEAEVRSALTVTAEPLTQVLRISFVATHAERAAEGAEAAAQQLLVARGNVLTGTGQQVSALRDSITTLRREIQQAETGPMKTPLRVELAEQLATLSDVLAGSADTGRVMNHASVPREAHVPNPEVTVASGAMVGLLLAVALGAVYDLSRPSGRLPRGRIGQQPPHQQCEPFHSLTLR